VVRQELGDLRRRAPLLGLNLANRLARAAYKAGKLGLGQAERLATLPNPTAKGEGCLHRSGVSYHSIGGTTTFHSLAILA
jgi:hypothetical protein